MLDIQGKTLINDGARKRDISSWEDVDISSLGTRERKRFYKRRSALREYLTTDRSIDEIIDRYHIPYQLLEHIVSNSLALHEDGLVWGYRALLLSPKDQYRQIKYAVKNNNQADVVEESIRLESVESTHRQDVGEGEQAVTAKRTVVEPVVSLETPNEPSPQLSEENEQPVESTVETVTASSEVERATLCVEQEVVPTEEELEREAEQEQRDVAREEEAEVVLSGASCEELTPEPVNRELSSTPQRLSPGRAWVLLPAAHPLKDQLTTEEQYLALDIKDVSSSAAKRSMQPRHQLRKRVIRMMKVQGKQHRREKIISLALVTALLLGILTPLGVGLAAYNIYNNVAGLTQKGVTHLTTVKSLLSTSKSDPMTALDKQRLLQVQAEFQGAESDFTQLQRFINRPEVQATVVQVAPSYGSKLNMAQDLVQVALDVSLLGKELTGVALIGSNVIHGSPLANITTQPLVSVSDIETAYGSMTHALYYIDDIDAHMSRVDLRALPISAGQKAQLSEVLKQLPQFRSLITQAQGTTGMLAWLLGVGQERRFLVQTMDRAELRPGGGFTGQYGILQIKDGRIAPLNLRDVALLDYAGNGMVLGRSAPPEYSWMSFGNWGLRDSNLSADFPTTARLGMQVFEEEGGGPVDGNIAFTPTFIEHILDVTGPIHVVEYNETITSKNLEERLHYYQQDYSAIAVQRQKNNDTSHAVRKAFTSLVGKLLMDKVRHLSARQLMELIKVATKDMQARELEVYFKQPQLEQWLQDHNYSGAIDKYTQQDGFMAVQANISISKASEYVHTSERDNIVLDAQGGATHTLTITLDYQQTGPVYGFDTYADYIRIYAPAAAQFIGGDGFDTGIPLCIPATGGCAQYKTTPPGAARYCPNGNYNLGNRFYDTPWPVDRLGAPPVLNSDLPERQMWGGLTATPKNCISYITAFWYVPHAVKNVNGQDSYAVLVQKQGGYVPDLELNVDASALATKGLSVKEKLVGDKVFSLPISKRP